MTQLVELQAATQKFADAGIKLYAISYDELGALEDFARHHGITYDQSSTSMKRAGSSRSGRRCLGIRRSVIGWSFTVGASASTCSGCRRTTSTSSCRGSPSREARTGTPPTTRTVSSELRTDSCRNWVGSAKATPELSRPQPPCLANVLRAERPGSCSGTSASTSHLPVAGRLIAVPMATGAIG